MVIAPSLVVDPRFPDKVMLPVPLARERVCAPSTVAESVIEPAPVPEFKTAALVKVIGLANERDVLLVNIVPEKFTRPAPVCVKDPEMALEAPAVRFKSPEFVMEKGPLFVVIKLPLMVMTPPFRDTPAAAFMLRSPV